MVKVYILIVHESKALEPLYKSDTPIDLIGEVRQDLNSVHWFGDSNVRALWILKCCCRVFWHE